MNALEHGDWLKVLTTQTMIEEKNNSSPPDNSASPKLDSIGDLLAECDDACKKGKGM